MLPKPLTGDPWKNIAEDNARLERENARLRGLLECRARQIAALRLGFYVLTEDGDFNGGPACTQTDVACFVAGNAEAGLACVVLEVKEVHPAPGVDEYRDWCDFYGVMPGTDFPATLAPSAR